jgi:hypothetical protein
MTSKNIPPDYAISPIFHPHTKRHQYGDNIWMVSKNLPFYSNNKNTE